jgi:hypothetical protein
MEGDISDSDRLTLVRAAVARVTNRELQAGLDRSLDPSVPIPKPMGNALKALRKHRDPSSVLDKAQYRATVPYVAALIADDSLSATIEALGDHSDDPTREQLLDALEQVRASYPDEILAVMLASVADGDMPASDLCFELATSDERFGLTTWSEFGAAIDVAPAKSAVASTTTPEQREARRLKKQKEAEERRKRMEASRKAGEQLRRARKKVRAGGGGDQVGPLTRDRAATASVAPHLTRRAVLTPPEEEEFDRDDSWTAGVVFAWIPFDSVDPEQPDVDGKSRRCVVVAGSTSHLLVRPGYSEGGLKSRDWKSVPLRHWRAAGFDQPTWIDIESYRIPRDGVAAPVGWLTPDDWNALW